MVPAAELATWNQCYSLIMSPFGHILFLQWFRNFCNFPSLDKHKVVDSNFKIDLTVDLTTFNQCYNFDYPAISLGTCSALSTAVLLLCFIVNMREVVALDL